MEIAEGFGVTIRKNEVLRLLGCGKTHGELRGDVSDLLDSATRECYRLIKPRAIYDWLRVKSVEEKSVRLEKGLVINTGGAIKAWRGADYLGVAICTIGPALEERVSELFGNKDYALGVMLDTVGSEAVEGVANHVNYLFCQMANGPGLSTGPRLSPGYGKWDLTDQKSIFALLPGQDIGVHLTEQCMMIPRKSISFCVGIGKALGHPVITTPCRHCNMEACSYRRDG